MPAPRLHVDISMLQAVISLSGWGKAPANCKTRNDCGDIERCALVGSRRARLEVQPDVSGEACLGYCDERRMSYPK
jgi:hypothetical protein